MPARQAEYRLRMREHLYSLGFEILLFAFDLYEHVVDKKRITIAWTLLFQTSEVVCAGSVRRASDRVVTDSDTSPKSIDDQYPNGLD